MSPSKEPFVAPVAKAIGVEAGGKLAIVVVVGDDGARVIVSGMIGEIAGLLVRLVKGVNAFIVLATIVSTSFDEEVVGGTLPLHANVSVVNETSVITNTVFLRKFTIIIELPFHK